MFDIYEFVQSSEQVKRRKARALEIELDGKTIAEERIELLSKDRDTFKRAHIRKSAALKSRVYG